jgi:WD40 repeat protein
MRLLKGHRYGQTVYAVAFAPDGARLASCGLDGTVRLWDLGTGTDQVLFQHPMGNALRWLAFAPGGSELAWASAGRIHFHELATARRREIISPQAFWCHTLCFAPGGRTLAGVGGQVFLVDLPELRVRPAWPGGEEAAGGLAFSPDGRRLAVGHSHRNPHTGRYTHLVKLWDPAAGVERAVLRGHRRPATALAFSPDGFTLAAACGPSLVVWDVPGERVVFQTRPGGQHFQGVAFTPDGASLGAAHNDRAVRFWQTRTWQERAAYDWDIGEVVSLAVAPDGMRAAAGSRRGLIVVWDLDDL